MFDIFIYTHLLATSLALGTILTADWRLFRGRHYVMRSGALSRLAFTRRIALLSLVVLWVSGALLIASGYAANPQSYFANEKLWAKLSVVLVLTVNGSLLHWIVFPRIDNATVFICLPWSQRLLFGALGVASGASWLFAAFLGVARSWNNAVAYQDIMLMYVVLLGMSLLVSALLLIERRTDASDAVLSD